MADSQVLYLTIDQANQHKQEQLNKLRLERLKQVREQAKQISKQKLLNYKIQQQFHQENFLQEQRIQQFENNKMQLERLKHNLEEQYESQIGAAFQEAKLFRDQQLRNAKQKIIDDQAQKLLTTVRYQKSLAKSVQEHIAREKPYRDMVQRKEIVNRIEKERTSSVVKRPLPSTYLHLPSYEESKQIVKEKPISKEEEKDEEYYQLTYYHKNLKPTKFTPQPRPQTATVLEKELLSKRQKEKERRREVEAEERKEREEQRSKEAFHKVQLLQNALHMTKTLEKLQQMDIKRKKEQIMQKKIHSTVEYNHVKNKQQQKLEHAFERQFLPQRHMNTTSTLRPQSANPKLGTSNKIIAVP